VIWRHSTDGKVRSAPTIADNSVYIGSTDGQLYALDLKTGLSEWDQPYKTVGAITSAPAVSSKLVVFQNNENRTYALNRETGEYAWDQGRPRPDFFTIQGEGGPTIAGNTVYAGYDDGFLVAMNVDDGAALWSKNLGAEQRHFVDVDSRPLVHGDTVYAGCFNVGLYAVGRKHGNVKWLHRQPGVQSAAIGHGLVYLTTGKREVHALDAKSGDLRWKLKLGYGDLSSPVLADELLWVSTGEAAVLINPQDGHVRGRLAPDDGQSAPVASHNGWVHMVTNSGALVGSRIH
jgi:outer membrane protein assembly factor BamB